MRSIKTWRPSPTLAVSFVALFAALSGTALALQANSIRSKHIVDGQVKTRDLGTTAVTREKLSVEAFNPTDIGLDPNSTDPVGRFGILPDAVSGPEVAPDSLTGDDFALASVTGTDIRNDSLTSSDVDELTLENPMWATVNRTGSIRSAGQSDTGSSRLSDGKYAVLFGLGRDIRGCAYSAAIRETQVITDSPGGPSFEVPRTAQVGAMPGAAPDEVRVRITSDEDDDEVNSAFSLVVVC